MNKHVLITGGTKGIGLETAKIYINNGYRISIIGRSVDTCELAEKPNVKLYKYDLSDLSGLASLIETIPPIDILINNAGIMYGTAIDLYTEKMKSNILSVNLEAQIELIRLISPYMISKGEGRIVNNASIAGQIGHPDIWYGVTKAGVINITKSFSKLLGPKGVIINCVAAGPVETDMLQAIPEERQKTIKSSVVTGRFAKPEEVAQVFYWLGTTSPEYVNGTCIDVNNGFYLR